MRIKLNHNKYTIVDDEDFEYLNQFKWRTRRNCNTYYAVRSIYNKKTKKRNVLRMSRVIMNAHKNMIVDHINGNGLDNRKQNLRLCTLKNNSRNRIKSPLSTNKYKGVHKVNRPLKKKYIAQIMVNRKHKKLGYFKTAKEAAIAYNKASIKYFKQFAKLNEV